jgi:hypothetical protein
MLLVLFVFLILIAGCETAKWALTGASEGLQRDWETLREADAWMRENLW